MYGGSTSFAASSGSLSPDQQVAPAGLTITANDQSMTYGGALPTLTASFAGFVNGDTASVFATSPNVPPSLSTVPATNHAGKYAIDVSGALDPDYTITYVSGTLTIKPASLTITADTKAITAGDALPTLTASYQGFVNGDSASSLVTPPALSTTATSTSLPGPYPITVSGAVEPDYTITFVSGTLHIARKGGPPTWIPTAASALTHSAEYYTQVIIAAYQHYLGRTPDAAGLAYWLGQMQNGLSDEHLEANFLGSAEYIKNHGGAGAGWVKGMYQDLLGRTPSQAEVDYWVGQLNKGVSTTDVAYMFAASKEREGLRITADYQKYLGRTPSQPEIDYWVNLFVTGKATNEDVVAGFAGSSEYFTSHFGNVIDWLDSAFVALLGSPATTIQTSVPTYLLPFASTLTHSDEYYTVVITNAYQRYLGRTPDSAGLAYWLGQMKKGLTDEHLESNFIGSTEYIKNHGGAGAGWVKGMYQDLLGRTPSQAELDYWVGQLNSGLSTTDVAYLFAASKEREGIRITADYTAFLGRTPTQSEIDYWVGLFVIGKATNEDVVAGFISSKEYFQKYQSDTHDWVEQVVMALLGTGGF
jgi:hypothetical protein